MEVILVAFLGLSILDCGKLSYKIFISFLGSLISWIIKLCFRSFLGISYSSEHHHSSRY
ncbi:uncharacterized protein DS421_11g333030 [Arachis hypogaea]|nr:uncharacterized protein DS421_11g333030 [Arachis hypogaea]